MKKILSFVIVCVLVLSGLGAVALPETKNNQMKTDESIKFISFSKPYIQEKGEYISLHIEESNLYVTEPCRPMMPMYVKTVELPFGAKNINVFCTVNKVHEQTISKKIIPASEPAPLHSEMKIQTDTSIDENIYSSTELYPNKWHSHRVGCGLNNKEEHVTHVAVQVYPVRYSPADNKIYYTDSVYLTITYDAPTKPVSFNDAYDLVVIAPKKFSRILNRFIDHKNDHGVPTVLKTVESIYEEYSGVDKPEQIKYFIKEAMEEWGITYVLLVGGLKSYYDNDDRDNENEGSTDWHVPVRYTNLYDDGDIQDPGFISDLYYADVYKAGGVFENWDSNGDGIFAAWDKPGVGNDVIDQYPDVCVGRLACRNRFEVRIMVNKIINYESTLADPSWFNKMVCVAGDSFQSDYEYEGELTCDYALAEMPDFEPVKLYTSYRDSGEGPTPTPENITEAASNGSGFLMFEGHGSPGTWATHYPGGVEWTPSYHIYKFPKLANKEKLPVCIVGGCHNSMFNVSFYKTYGPENGSYWTYGMPVPECFSWWLTRKIGGGSIASLGCTGLGYGVLDMIGLSAYLDYLFFYAYGQMGKHILGETWSAAVTEYISTTGFFGKLDVKTVEQWPLIGDPSLMIGGYTA